MDINLYSPKGKIKNTSLLKLADYSTEEIYEILHLAKLLKNKQQAKEAHKYLTGKTIALLFSKASTRTRLSFEMGIRQMNGSTIYLTNSDSQLGRGESIKDTAAIIKRYGIDGIMVRTYKQQDVEDFAKYSELPVINGLTDSSHPCQVLADILTIWENKGKLSNLKFCYIGDGNNMANSLLIGGVKCDMNVTICSPEKYQISKEIEEIAQQYGDFTLTNNPQLAVQDADVIYTDVWCSMGQSDSKEKKDAFNNFQINKDLFSKAKKDCIFMHCLPAHRGEEVSEDIIDGENSVIYTQAENRLHVQKAVLSLLIK